MFCPVGGCGREVLVPTEEIKSENVALDTLEWRLITRSRNKLNLCELRVSLANLRERVDPGSVCYPALTNVT